MEIGDYVTQSKCFFDYWKCDIFIRKIIDIHNDIIYLEKGVDMISTINDTEITATHFHSDYLVICKKTLRKRKLKKLNLL